MKDDPYINPDAEWRKGARIRRKRRGPPLHCLFVLLALVILGGGLTYYLLHPPSAADRLEDLVTAFRADWETLDSDSLWRKWFVDDFKRRAAFGRLMGRKGWSERRPPITLTGIYGHPGGTLGRMEFYPEGLPDAAWIKVFWQEKYGHWKGTAVKLAGVPDAITDR